MEDLQHGELNCFLSAVLSDETLDMQIRNNTATIYYRGGKLCELTYNDYGYYEKFFDKKYVKDYTIGFDYNLENRSHKEWVAYIPTIKEVMDHSFLTKGKTEDEYLQKVVWENNRSSDCNSTDYTITDTYSNFYINKDCYTDIVAAKIPKEEKNGYNDIRLAFIEVKVGDGSLTGGAGIVSHVKDWCHLLYNNHNSWENLCDESKNLYNQKKILGLLNNAQFDVQSISHDYPELLLLIADHNPRSSILYRELCILCKTNEYIALRKKGCSLKIADVSSAVRKLQSDMFADIEEYISMHHAQFSSIVSKPQTQNNERKYLSKKGSNSKSSSIASQEKFIDSVSSEQLKQLYLQLFDYTNSAALKLKLGTTGFSMNTFNALLFYGYGGLAANKKNSIETVRGKSNIDDDVWHFYSNELRKLRFFEATSNNNYRWQLSGKSTEAEMNMFIAVIDQVINKIRKD